MDLSDVNGSVASPTGDVMSIALIEALAPVLEKFVLPLIEKLFDNGSSSSTDYSSGKISNQQYLDDVNKDLATLSVELEKRGLSLADIGLPTEITSADQAAQASDSVTAYLKEHKNLAPALAIDGENLAKGLEKLSTHFPTQVETTSS
jgi:hypothetical protein